MHRQMGTGGADASERERLIEAMAACCLRQGYAETSLEDVVSQAGLTTGAFERHFEDLESCGLAAVDRILGLGMAQVSSGFLPDRPERESAVRALFGLLELFAAHPALTQLAFTGSRQAMGTAALARYDSGFAILTAMLDRLRSDGAEGEGPPSLAARAAIGGGEALVRREISAGRTPELPRVLPDLVYSAAVPFLGMEEALHLARSGRELLQGTRWA